MGEQKTKTPRDPGQGQLLQRGKNKWLIRVYDGRDGAGRRRYINETVHGTSKAANARLVEILNGKNHGTYVRPTKGTLREHIDKWLETCAKQRVSPKTFDGYTWQLAQIPKSLGDRRLSSIRGEDVQQFYSELLEREFSPKTIRHIHTALSGALSKAVEWRLIHRNPCDTAELPRLEHREMQSLSAEEAARFLAAAKDDKLGVVFAFALFTGARPAEVFALKWSDIDFARATATIQRTLQWRKKRKDSQTHQPKENASSWYFDKPKTKRSRRTVPLPAGLVQQLREHRSTQAEALLKIGIRSELVFATSEGTPLHWQNVTKRHFKPVLERAGLPASFRLYDLRHSCATLLLQDGLNPKIVSERLGHASIVLTLDTYSHVLPDMQSEAAESLQRRFYG